ncbi:MAG: DUF4296 domain-containing protein [Bacteroidia bacterium]
MQKYLFVAICAVMFCACSNPNQNQLPANVLTQQQMEAVLYDMHLAEGLLTTEPKGGDTTARRALGMYEQIYKKHNITPEQFKASYQYYTNNPVVFDSVYNKIIERLSVQESILRK